MKTAVLTAPGKFEIREKAAPKIENDDDVLLRTALVGICGSDLHYFSSPRVGDLVLPYPVTLGHECAAVVEAAGPAANRLRPGDRAVIEPAVSCGGCDQCLAERPNTCRRLKFLGSPGQLDGALSEFIVVPERNVHLLPEGMSPARGVLAEPLSIALWAVDLAGPLENAAVAVLGSGPIGLSVCLSARLNGARTVYATEKVDARLKAAGLAGADWTGNPLESDIVVDIMAREPLGLDAVFECCGRQEAVDQAVRLLKPGGTLVMVGIPIEERISFEISRLRRKEIRLQNVRRQNRRLDKAVELIAGGILDLDFTATHTFGMNKIQEAFETVLHYRDGAVKVMIAP